MANGEMVEELRKMAQTGNGLDEQAYRRLMLAGLADIYEAFGRHDAAIDVLKADVDRLKNDNKWIIGRDVATGFASAVALIKSFLP